LAAVGTVFCLVVPAISATFVYKLIYVLLNYDDDDDDDDIFMLLPGLLYNSITVHSLSRHSVIICDVSVVKYQPRFYCSSCFLLVYQYYRLCAILSGVYIYVPQAHCLL